MSSEALILLQHHAVVTLGRGDPVGAGVLASHESLVGRGIELASADRGGETTYHAPGQVVGYPILTLRDGERDLHRYLRNLEEMLIRALADLGLVAGRINGLTGVWVHDAKIAAIGIKVRGWVTMHGFALNNTIDLTPFRRDIVPCGIADHDVTSLAECGVVISRRELEVLVVKHFSAVFDRAVHRSQPLSGWP